METEYTRAIAALEKRAAARGFIPPKQVPVNIYLFLPGKRPGSTVSLYLPQGHPLRKPDDDDPQFWIVEITNDWRESVVSLDDMARHLHHIGLALAPVRPRETATVKRKGRSLD